MTKLKTLRRGPTPQQIAYHKAAQKPGPWAIESHLDDTPGIVPTGREGPAQPRREAPAKPRTIAHKLDLTDPRIEARIEMNDAGHVILLHDHGGNQSVPGLRLRIGPRTAHWIFYRDALVKGDRKITSKSLGHFPAVDTAAARAAAGRELGAPAKPGMRAAVKLKAAVETYIVHLRKVADKRGKPDRWARNVEGFAKNLEPFENWSLADLSNAPADVMAWHQKLTVKAGPVTANHSAKIMRAAYRWASRLDPSLPPHLPTSAVEWNSEERSQNALDPADFPKWQTAWLALADKSPIRAAFQKINLLTGCRPGELMRLKWADVDEHRFVIRSAKASNDISVPLSESIARELRRARDAGKAGSVWVFPGRVGGGHIAKCDIDDLPAHGMELRRTYRTIAAELGVDELVAHFLLGHRPAGISQGYIIKLTLMSGGAMRKAQHDISERIEALLAGRL